MIYILLSFCVNIVDGKRKEKKRKKKERKQTDCPFLWPINYFVKKKREVSE